MHVLFIADRDAKTALARDLQGKAARLLVSRVPVFFVYSRPHAPQSPDSSCLC